MINPDIPRENDGTVPKWAWPGGYPLFYVCEDGGDICSDCVNHDEGFREIDAPDWNVNGYAINYEDPELYCDGCGRRIESAYAER